jgi:hypothetical protein
MGDSEAEVDPEIISDGPQVKRTDANFVRVDVSCVPSGRDRR